MKHFGKVAPGSTIEIPFSSFASADGANATISGFTVSSIKVYKNGSTTERSSTSGFVLLDTDGIDFDGKTGLNGFTIDLSDNANAGFYEAGARYLVALSGVVVDGQTINDFVASFQIGVEGAILATSIASLSTQTVFALTAGPAEDDALNGCMVYCHDVASPTQLGFATVLDYVGSTKTVTLAAGPTFTLTAADNVIFFPPTNARWHGGVLQTGGDLAGLLAALATTLGGAALETSLQAVKAKSDQLTFSGTNVNAAIRQIDEEPVTGDGTPQNPWRAGP